jgi:hypothetical protein
MSAELVFEYVVMLALAAVVVYGFWAWRRGRVTRKSTRAAIVFGCVAVISAVVVDVLNDFMMPDNYGAAAAVVTVVSVLLSFAAFIALFAAIVSLTIRAISRQRGDSGLVSQPAHPQPPSA